MHINRNKIYKYIILKQSTVHVFTLYVFNFCYFFLFSWFATILFQLCTLLGMWLIPVFICVQRYWWRFLITWIVYSVLSTVVWYRATRPQISGKTPRLAACFNFNFPIVFVFFSYCWLFCWLFHKCCKLKKLSRFCGMYTASVV